MGFLVCEPFLGRYTVTENRNLILSFFHAIPASPSGVESSPSGVSASVIQEIVDRSLSSVTASLAKVVDDRLEEFKKRFASDPAIDHPSKRLKLEAKQIKRPGNQQKFDHCIKVLEKFESALDALSQSKVEKARDAIKEGIELVVHRIKLVRIADKSEFGWETVNQYEADELASDSEDGKGIYRSERRAERKQKDRKKKRPVSARGLPGAACSGTFPIPSHTSNREPITRSSLGPC